jgi:hypothetical protein
MSKEAWTPELVARLVKEASVKPDYAAYQGGRDVVVKRVAENLKGHAQMMFENEDVDVAESIDEHAYEMIERVVAEKMVSQCEHDLGLPSLWTEVSPDDEAVA